MKPGILLKALLLAVMVYFIQRHVALGQVVQELSGCHVGYLLLALLCTLFVPLTMGWRFSYVAGLPVQEGISCLLRANYMNSFLPGQIGGDIYKVYYLAKVRGSRRSALSLVASDRLIGMASGVSIALFNVFIGSGYFSNEKVYAAIAAYLGIVMFAFTVIFLLPESPLRLLGRFSEQLRLARKQLHSTLRKRVFGGMLITAVCYLCLVGLNIFAQLSLGYSLNLTAAFLYMPVLTIVSLTLPISFNGLGVRESLYVLLFSMAGFSGESSLAMASVHLVCLLTVSAFGGLLLVLRSHAPVPSKM